MLEHHDTPFAGHLGYDKTYASISELFYWPKLAKDVKLYVGSCDSCQCNKPSHTHPAGLLQPLPIPSCNWDSISMDFIVELPKSRLGFDAITVFVDRLSKMAHFVPCHTASSAPQIAELFMSSVFHAHGLPSSIVSDRDPCFTGHFWKALWKHLNTSLDMSTAFHLQTDGQTK